MVRVTTREMSDVLDFGNADKAKKEREVTLGLTWCRAGFFKLRYHTSARFALKHEFAELEKWCANNSQDGASADVQHLLELAKEVYENRGGITVNHAYVERMLAKTLRETRRVINGESSSLPSQINTIKYHDQPQDLKHVKQRHIGRCLYGIGLILLGIGAFAAGLIFAKPTGGLSFIAGCVVTGQLFRKAAKEMYLKDSQQHLHQLFTQKPESKVGADNMFESIENIQRLKMSK